MANDKGTKPVTIRLPVDMIATLKIEAGKKSVGYQTMIRMWLAERLQDIQSDRKK